jgi:hypothetical protein
MLMAALVVGTAFVAGYVVFGLEGSVLPQERHPDASFRFAYDETTDELAVTHYGGDNLNADRVVLLNRAFDEVGAWTATETVSAGDTATVRDVSPGDTVYVMWETPDGTYLTLATWNPDGAVETTTSAPSNPTADPARTTAHATRAVPRGAGTATFLIRIE